METWDEKVTRFKKRQKINDVIENVARIKNYLGYEYVKISKDVNGFNLNEKHLREYSGTIRYTITVMRNICKKSYLYNYFVPNDKLCDFFADFASGKIEGELIEIEKFNPEILA